MRPHLQPVFPCLAGLLSVWQSVDFVNILAASDGIKSRRAQYIPSLYLNDWSDTARCDVPNISISAAAGKLPSQIAAHRK